MLMDGEILHGSKASQVFCTVPVYSPNLLYLLSKELSISPQRCVWQAHKPSLSHANSDAKLHAGCPEEATLIARRIVKLSSVITHLPPPDELRSLM